MSLNYSFLIDQVGRLKGNSATLLDYGCGHGELVAAAIAHGHVAYGCDTYSDMWSNWQFDVLCANRGTPKELEPSDRDLNERIAQKR